MARASMAFSHGSGMAEQGQIVGFRGATGENQLFCFHAKASGEPVAGITHRRRRGEPKPVLTTGGVAPLRLPPGGHRHHHLLCTGGGGLEVEGDWVSTLHRTLRRTWQHGVTSARDAMQAAQRPFSLLLLLAGGLWMQAAAAIDRDELLNQMKSMRPSTMATLETRQVDGGLYTLGLFSLAGDEADPNLRRYKLWKEYPHDLVVPTESVNCSTTTPMRVTRDDKAIYLRRLNPGGVITPANREDYLVWWAACVPDQAGVDPSTLRQKAQELGYSTLLRESVEVLRLPQ